MQQHSAREDVSLGLPLTQEDQARADFYGLLARLLLTPPDAPLRDALAANASLGGVEPPQQPQPLDTAWEKLSMTAALLSPAQLVEEFDALFVSTGSPRISPHGSIYLAGFLHEKPLALLRADLARLGLGRRPGASETEDHLGVLCETMRQLIVRRRSLEVQQAFFTQHIGSWYALCLKHIHQAEGAQFYARLAELADSFFLIEQEAFVLSDEPATI